MIYTVTVEIGHPRYEDLIGPLRADATLLATMWQEAESRLDEEPGKRWVIAVDDGIAAAWACAVGRDGELKCCNNYERPAYRGRGLYAAAYAERHHTIVAPWPGPAVTYIFVDPLALHEADGWRVTGEGDSDEPDVASHHWYELRRP